MLQPEPSVLELDNPFWRFSLAVYAEPLVRQECLDLQDRIGADVNLVLFCAWLAVDRHVRLEPRDVAQARTVVSEWHIHVVRQLREVRRSIKAMGVHAHPEVAAYRSSISGIELGAEQIEQALLFEWADARWPRTAALRSPAPPALDNIHMFLAQEHPEEPDATSSMAALGRIALSHRT